MEGCVLVNAGEGVAFEVLDVEKGIHNVVCVENPNVSHDTFAVQGCDETGRGVDIQLP